MYIYVKRERESIFMDLCLYEIYDYIYTYIYMYICIYIMYIHVYIFIYMSAEFQNFWIYFVFFTLFFQKKM